MKKLFTILMVVLCFGAQSTLQAASGPEVTQDKDPDPKVVKAINATYYHLRLAAASKTSKEFLMHFEDAVVASADLPGAGEFASDLISATPHDVYNAASGLTNEGLFSKQGLGIIENNLDNWGAWQLDGSLDHWDGYMGGMPPQLQDHLIDIYGNGGFDDLMARFTLLDGALSNTVEHLMATDNLQIVLTEGIQAPGAPSAHGIYDDVKEGATTGAAVGGAAGAAVGGVLGTASGGPQNGAGGAVVGGAVGAWFGGGYGAAIGGVVGVLKKVFGKKSGSGSGSSSSSGSGSSGSSSGGSGSSGSSSGDSGSGSSSTSGSGSGSGTTTEPTEPASTQGEGFYIPPGSGPEDDCNTIGAVQGFMPLC